MLPTCHWAETDIWRRLIGWKGILWFSWLKPLEHFFCMAARTHQNSDKSNANSIYSVQFYFIKYGGGSHTQWERLHTLVNRLQLHMFSLVIADWCSHIYKHVQMCSIVERVTHSVPGSLLTNESLMYLQRRGITHTLWDLLPSGLYFISSLISQHRPQSQCLDHLYHYCCYHVILTDWMLLSGSLH